jgi:dUTP pyrophosphatase
MEPILQFRYLNPEKDSDIPLPRYMTPRSSGMDICAAVEEDIILEPGAIRMIPTGFAIAIPPGFEAQIRPRSGLAAKHGISLINTPGTIDADYRGEVMLALINLGQNPYKVSRGDRVAQMVIQKVCQVRLKVVEELEETDRNTGGFGHTGLQ